MLKHLRTFFFFFSWWEPFIARSEYPIELKKVLWNLAFKNKAVFKFRGNRRYCLKMTWQMLWKFVLKHCSQVKSCLPSYNLEHISTTQQSSLVEGLRRSRALTLCDWLGKGKRTPVAWKVACFSSCVDWGKPRVKRKVWAVLSLRFTFISWKVCPYVALTRENLWSFLTRLTIGAPQSVFEVSLGPSPITQKRSC